VNQLICACFYFEGAFNMDLKHLSRRDYLKAMGAGALAISDFGVRIDEQIASSSTNPQSAIRDPQSLDRARRMKWWHDAKFGMFIHWGLYSVVGRHEWVMENEGIPIAEYEQLAKRFNPKLNGARDWARLAKRAGMKYMVMTTKHHEGFCLFDTRTTNYCAPKHTAGRDLVREYVEAVRAEGLRVGFYYSLMDWHHPDGARCETDEAARKRFVEYIHTHVRELMTNYGKIDVLWYDVSWPLEAAGWESERMNQMVFQLQPDIIVNNRNRLPGDFSTPEQRIQAEEGERAWESCMTMNDSWGYHRNDDNWKTPKQVIRNLIACSRDGGNYLLNIGPKPDGSIPEESIRILTSVGQWMDKNGQAIYATDRCQPRRSNYATFTRKGNTLFVHVHFWPGETVTVAGLMTPVKSARLLATGRNVEFQQDRFRVRFTGLPPTPPDDPITTIAVECESEPRQDNIFVRREKPRGQV
jgi:alpha-L-fucosidase